MQTKSAVKNSFVWLKIVMPDIVILASCRKSLGQTQSEGPGLYVRWTACWTARWMD